MVKYPALCIITTRVNGDLDSHIEIAQAAIKGGASMIQLRDKTASTKDLISLGKKIKEFIRGKNVKLIVNDNVEAALKSGCDGVHLGVDDTDIHEARNLLERDKIIGASASSIEEAKTVIIAGADYLGVGPVYNTGSKDDAGTPIGVLHLKKIVDMSAVPVVAIGGIDESNVSEVMKSGVSGIAVLSAIANAADKTDAVMRLKEIICHSEGGVARQLRHSEGGEARQLRHSEGGVADRRIPGK